jgi:hypothetical protein
MSPPVSSWSWRSSCKIRGFTFVLACVKGEHRGQMDTHLEAIVGPTAKFHFATLIIERKPRDIYFTRRLENPRWHIQTRTIISHYYVRWICTIKSFIGAVISKFGLKNWKQLRALVTSSHLLYIKTSGFHIRCGGIRRSLTPPYSVVFHLKFMSFHS